jgi:gluconolactonase
MEGSRLMRWDPNGSVTVVRENTGEGNGCTLARQGRLIMCEGADHRRITRMEADGTVTAIAERWQGKRFDKPNDVVCRSDGSIYFTDPGLRLPAELRRTGFSYPLSHTARCPHETPVQNTGVRSISLRQLCTEIWLGRQ